MADNHSIIAELRTRRRTLGMTGVEVAARLNANEGVFSAWENEQLSPSLDALEQWAAVLGLRLLLTASHEEARRGIRVEWDKRRVTVDGAPVRLTPMEWRVIERLARTPGALVTHQELYRYVYGQDWTSRGQATAVRVLITKLRRLLPLQIEARWGQGYTLTGIEPARAGEAELVPTATAEPDLGSAHSRDLSTATAVNAPKLISRTVPALRPPLLRNAESVGHHAVAAVARVAPCRADELGVIERFLAERGVTRCPDVRTIEKSPLPALVWDKTKRKWVRPASAELRTG